MSTANKVIVPAEGAQAGAPSKGPIVIKEDLEEVDIPTELKKKIRQYAKRLMRKVGTDIADVTIVQLCMGATVAVIFTSDGYEERTVVLEEYNDHVRRVPRRDIGELFFELVDCMTTTNMWRVVKTWVQL